MMMKRMILIMAVAFACISFLMIVSCAQKTTTVEPEKPAVTEEKKETKETKEEQVEKKTEEEKAPTPAREERKVEVSREEEKKPEKEAPRKVEVKQAVVDVDLGMRTFEGEKIYFDYDKSELKPEARAVLKKKAEWLRNNPDFSARIEGHCDDRGTNAYNLALGERRANAAWRFLNALGISGSRLTTISYGEERPADPGQNDDAWSKNRRDEFKLLK
jgi:peptidoglycan-associated lipoprotein